jgi:hypothetical protein
MVTRAEKRIQARLKPDALVNPNQAAHRAGSCPTRTIPGETTW